MNKLYFLISLLFAALVLVSCEGIDDTQEGNKGNQSSKDPFNGHAYVDLNLPSGLLWATMNLGAKSPEEAGDYFSWGEISKKASYTKENYTLPKQIELDSKNDVATVLWGGKWRMPSKKDFQELKDECDWTWDATKKGYNIKSKTSDKSIFLYTTGYYNDSDIRGAGTTGYYWARTRNGEYGDYLDFNDGYINITISDAYKGQVVRAVVEK